MPNYFGNNQTLMNQLLRQKDNVENLIQQYSQMPQAPIQNIINQGSNLDFEARILQPNEDPMNIAVTRRTMFLDESQKKVLVKELDGTISKEYEIIVPLDEKDKKILELENRLKEMEVKFNNEYSKPIRTSNEQHKPNEFVDINTKSPTKTNGEQFSKPTK